MLEFLLAMEEITGELTEPKLFDYALKKAVERIKRDTTALLDKTPIKFAKGSKWRRWNA